MVLLLLLSSSLLFCSLHTHNDVPQHMRFHINNPMSASSPSGVRSVPVAVDASPKRAIVIGASVGMGRALCKELAADGYIVGMSARRVELLEELQQEIPTQTYVRRIDVAEPEEAVENFQALVAEMGGLDLLVITVTGFYDCEFDNRAWQHSRPVLDVDVVGFFALARTAMMLFEEQGQGHLVGFSSVDGFHGASFCPAYSASKAFCSRYLEAERNYCKQHTLAITVTEIIPGYVDSKKDFDYAAIPSAYWVETLEDATKEIFEAIKNRDSVAYVTKRQQKVIELLRTIDNDLYNALCARPGGAL